MIKGKYIFEIEKKFYIHESPEILNASEHDNFLLIKVWKYEKNKNDFYYLGISQYNFEEHYINENNYEIVEKNIKRVDVLQIYYSYMDEYSKYISRLLFKKNNK